jgi:hypothetical protein
MAALLNTVQSLYTQHGLAHPKMFVANNGNVVYATQISVERSLNQLGYKLIYRLKDVDYPTVQDALRALRKVMHKHHVVAEEVVDAAGYKMVPSYINYLYKRMPASIRLDVAAALAETLDCKLEYIVTPKQTTPINSDPPAQTPTQPALT